MKWMLLPVLAGTLLAATGNQEKDLNAAQWNARGLELNQQGRYPEAEDAYRRSLAAWDQLGPQTALSRGITAGNLGMLLLKEGRYAESEPLLAGSLKQIEGAAGHESGETARAVENLAALYLAWELPSQAEPYARRAAAIFEGLANDGEEARASHRLLGSILLAERRFSEAEELLRALLPDVSERAAIGVYNDLAVAESSQSHLAEAEPLARKALDLARRVLPPNHPLIAVSLNNLAQVQRFEGRYLEAEQNYRAAIDIWKRALGAGHPDVGKGLMNLGAFYHDRGRDAGAEDLYRQAASIFESVYGNNHPLTLVARNELSEVLRAQGRYSESERLSRETLAPLERTLGERDPRVLRALTNYARLLEETRHVRDAAAIRRRIDALQQGFRDPNG